MYENMRFKMNEIMTLAKFTMMNGLFLFVADWAGEACTSANQILSASASKHAVPFTVVNEDSDSANLFDSMRIEVVPSVVAVKGGKEVGRVEGVDSKGIISSVDKYVNFKEDEPEAKVESINTKPATNDVLSTATNINAYSNEQIVALVNRHKMMLFIKGTPERPQCGFTGQLLCLLSDNGLTAQNGHFSTFNILDDAALRAALKEWAQWPTYPQIYWKGELLGGLDILKEMFATGQMDAILEELKQGN